MLTHIVLMRLTPEATEAQVEAMVDALRALPSQIPAVGTYRVDRDLGLMAGNADVAITATFATAEDLLAYVEHPAHQAVVAEHILPITAERARIQHPS